jgi:phage terminase small subunit
MPRRNELTPKQRAFITAYLTNGRNAKAAYEAVYATKGGNAAAVEAVKLVQHPRVAAVIAEANKQADARIAAIARQYAITQERSAQSLAWLACTDMRDYVAWGPDGVRVKSSDKLTEAQSYGVGEVSQTKAGIRIKLHDKAKAIMDLAKLQGWLEHEQPRAGDDEKRREARAQLIKMLEEMAVPQPLMIDQAEDASQR